MSIQQQLDFGLGISGPIARRTDPKTSLEAGKAFTQDRLTEIQAAVLSWFKSHRTGTDMDIEDALLSKYPGFSTLRKRRCDLVTLGYLEDSGDRTLNRHGRKMIVWRLR